MYRYLLIATAVLAAWSLFFLPRAHVGIADKRSMTSVQNIDMAQKTAPPSKDVLRIFGTRALPRPVATGSAPTAQELIPAPPQPENGGRRELTDPSDALANVSTAIDELKPLLDECYELGRYERPSLSDATAMVGLSIVSENNRSVVIKSDFAEGSDELPKAFSECILETMYRLPLPPPKFTDSIVVAYPLHFAVGGVRTLSDSVEL